MKKGRTIRERNPRKERNPKRRDSKRKPLPETLKEKHKKGRGRRTLY
jgi:hypothetical protein